MFLSSPSRYHISWKMTLYMLLLFSFPSWIVSYVLFGLMCSCCNLKTISILCVVQVSLIDNPRIRYLKLNPLFLIVKGNHYCRIKNPNLNHIFLLLLLFFFFLVEEKWGLYGYIILSGRVPFWHKLRPFLPDRVGGQLHQGCLPTIGCGGDSNPNLTSRVMNSLLLN